MARRLLAARAELFLYVTTGIANVLSFGYQFVMARLLRPDDFALLTQLFGVLVVEAIGTQVIQSATAKLAAQYRARDDAPALHVFVRRWSVRFAAVGVPTAAVAAAASGALSDLVALPALAIALLGVTLGLALFLTFELGLLQGLRRFYWLGADLISQSAARLIAGTALVVVGFGLNGAFIGATLALVTGALLALIPLRPLFAASRTAVAEASLGAHEARFFGAAAVVLLAYAGLVNADAIVAPLVLSGSEAGAYAGAITTAKVILFAPIAIGFILLERTAREHERGADTDRALFLALGLVLATSGVAAVVSIVAPAFVVGIVVGSQYGSTAALVPVYAIAALSNALLNIWIAYFVGRGRLGIGWVLLAGLVVEVAILGGFVRDGATMARVVVMTSLSMQLVAIVAFGVGRLRAPRESRAVA